MSGDYIIIPNLSNPTSDMLISFKLKTCGKAYIGLMSAVTDISPLYEIIISFLTPYTSSVRICREDVVPKEYKEMRLKLYCHISYSFFITWNDTSITVGQGWEIDGFVFLTWSISDNLQSIVNVGIRTEWKGYWIFYTEGNEFQSNCVIDISIKVNHHLVYIQIIVPVFC